MFRFLNREFLLPFPRLTRVFMWICLKITIQDWRLPTLNRPAPSPIVFPQIADGDGYMTEVVLLSPAGEASTTLSYLNASGVPLEIGD